MLQQGRGCLHFKLGRYVLAERYLKAATMANPHDTESATRLKSAELVLQMDPFRQGLADARRDQIVADAFAVAGQRLKSCNMQTASFTTPVTQPSLAETWQRVKPHVTALGLQRHPELVETAMDLVFRIESETAASCGAPSETDAALLRIAKLHEGS